jgi:putative membrane protein
VTAGGWQRLDVRMVWINAAKFLLSLIPGVLGLFVFATGDVWSLSGPVWPLVIASAAGIVSTVLDVKRWLTTRYRVTGERVERRTGWLVRRYRHVPRDRIRNVDTSAKPRHRLARLRVVHIGTGAASMSSAFKLDALSVAMARQLRDELMPERDDVRETAISRARWYWVFYNIFHVWAFLAAALFLGSLWLSLQTIGVDLLAVLGDLFRWADLGLRLSIVVGVAAAFLLGAAVLAADFFASYWNFELVRVTGDDGSALLTRQGLFTTRTVHREDRRIRGIHLHEPLLWRWLRLAETKVITTGLRGTREEMANILPRGPVGAARHAARSVFPDDLVPLEVPLNRHPRGALTRRLSWATWGPVLAAGLLAWLGTTGAVPQGFWPVLLVLLPVGWALAFVGYRALGHQLVGPYLVVRSGALGRSTSVLQQRAVVGWELRQTVLQRLWGRTTVGVLTSAGDRLYRAPDASTAQALAFIKGATPELADEFIEPRST